MVILIDEEVHVTTFEYTVKVHLLDPLVWDLAVSTQLVLLFDVRYITLNELIKLALVQNVIDFGLQSAHQKLGDLDLYLIDHDLADYLSLLVADGRRERTLQQRELDITREGFNHGDNLLILEGFDAV